LDSQNNTPVSTPAQANRKRKKSPKWLRTLGVVFGRFMIFVLVTVLLTAFALYGVMYVLAKGPSPTARDIFVMSVRETSAVGFLANLFFTDEQIAQIENRGDQEEVVDIDTSLIEIPKPTEKDPSNNSGPKPDAWGLVDEDGDGIIIQTVRGEGYTGYMMVVLDPSRVVMATKPEMYGIRGYTVAQMVEQFDGVAGINAGGFYDPNGQGNGSIPDTMVVSGGKVYYPEKGVSQGFVGFDSNYIMHVGKPTPTEIAEKNIQSGVCFGPVLVANGESVINYFSGVNPRTGIGQRSDGAILMLVIDGRQVTSLGATYEDMAEIFLAYGAVNACNLDGGSSSMMWYEGEYINNCASVSGIRPIPTAFVVLKKGGSGNG
jgi:exopolysaccharide biosynthesis protein